MRAAVALVFLFLLASPIAIAAKSLKVEKQSSSVTTKFVGEKLPQVDLCGICVSFLGQSINQLLNIILNGGVVGSCGGLCAQLSNNLESTVCDLLCDYVGITEFVKLIQYEDPDPIYLCQLFDACPIVQGGQVNITTAFVTPKSGSQGSTFTIVMNYRVIKPTGPGSLNVVVVPGDGSYPVGAEQFVEGQSVGNYNIEWQVQTQPSENEPWAAGTYQTQVAVCEGDCTTNHPYGGVYAFANTQFKIA